MAQGAGSAVWGDGAHHTSNDPGILAMMNVMMMMMMMVVMIMIMMIIMTTTTIALFRCTGTGIIL